MSTALGPKATTGGGEGVKIMKRVDTAQPVHEKVPFMGQIKHWANRPMPEVAIDSVQHYIGSMQNNLEVNQLISRPTCPVVT